MPQFACETAVMRPAMERVWGNQEPYTSLKQVAGK